MTSADTETMTALQTLLSERQRYEGWLRTLNERRDSTPTHVFERVFSDYLRRLEGVRSRLTEHTDQLRATIATMTSKLDELRTVESDRIDTRAEAELRAAVGEYSDEEWTQLREDADLEIEMMTQERQELETELTELQAIVASSEAPEAIRTNGTNTSSRSTVASDTASGSGSGASDQTTESVTATASSQNSATHTSSASNGAGNGAASGTAKTPERDAGSSKDALNGAPSLNDFVDWPARRDPPTPTPQGDGIPRAPEVADNVTGGTAAAVAATPSAPPGSGTSRSSGNSRKTPPGGVSTQARSGAPIAEPPRRDNEKSLKCPECGALNYATEWYCERCGGELATF